jgi:hypothetical protein
VPGIDDELDAVHTQHDEPVRSSNSKLLSGGQFYDRVCEWRRRIGFGCWAM